METAFSSTKDAIITEIINLNAILNLPKGTEHFMSDLHGEYSAFQHVLRNASGSLKEKAALCLKQDLTAADLTFFTFLLYYPEDMIQKKKDSLQGQEFLNPWYKQTILSQIKLIHFVSTKYSRSKVRKTFPEQFVYIIEELLYRETSTQNKKAYYDQIISDIIRLEQAPALITTLSYSIQRLVVDHLHVVGDIYDRGPEPDKIIDSLINYHSLDIQWGNHDITWMGAYAGSPICLMTVIRICARYGNLSIIEEVYGIDLSPLKDFANSHYQNNPAFQPKNDRDIVLSEVEKTEISQIEQATAILQFKLESQLIKRRPEFEMAHRLLLDQIDYDTQKITLNGRSYPLTNTCFQTINPDSPDQLSRAEELLLEELRLAFQSSKKLKRHTDFLIEKGSIYLCYNHNLLIHGCIPLNSDGTFKGLTLQGKELKGKLLLDTFEQALRTSHRQLDQRDDLATDLIWYLWTGPSSSLFGKNEMTTFERYFIADRDTHQETKDDYYHLRNQEEICLTILNEFGLTATDSHIINGHTPVKEITGEQPIKANGKMIIIDGGFSKPYQATTGIAGYTLIYNSFGIELVAHQPFSSKKSAIESFTDVISTKRLVDRVIQRKKIKDTTIGLKLQQELLILESQLSSHVKRTASKQ